MATPLRWLLLLLNFGVQLLRFVGREFLLIEFSRLKSAPNLQLCEIHHVKLGDLSTLLRSAFQVVDGNYLSYVLDVERAELLSCV